MTELRKSSMRGRCCFKCIHWRGCPTMGTAGSAGHVCDDFVLDRTRWATPSTEVWQAEARKKRGENVYTIEEWRE